MSSFEKKPVREIPSVAGQDPRWCGSTLAKVSDKEIREAQKEFSASGKCKHDIIYDVPGWPYDVRYCFICEELLGVV